jgi:hypothetical protein
MEPLLASVRLPSSLAELERNPLFAAAAAAPFDAAELAAWLKGARQQPLAAMEWGLVLAAVKAGQQQGWQAAGLRAGQLVSVLAWAAEGAQQQLLQGAGRPAAAAGSSAAPAVEDVGNPRQRQALQSTLKLSLFFLCCITRGDSSAAVQQVEAGGGAQKPAAKKAKGGGGGSGGEAASFTAQLQLRRDALLAVGSIEEGLWADPALLPAVSDLRAGHRLVRATALHCLVHPLAPAGGGGSSGGDRSSKALADSCFEAMAGQRKCGGCMAHNNCCIAASHAHNKPLQ